MRQTLLPHVSLERGARFAICGRHVSNQHPTNPRLLAADQTEIQFSLLTVRRDRVFRLNLQNISSSYCDVSMNTFIARY